jgi:hypothetical protein
MTVKELIKQLKTQDSSTEILVSRDEEGNGFSSLEDATLENEIEDRKGTYLVLWP